MTDEQTQETLTKEERREQRRQEQAQEQRSQQRRRLMMKLGVWLVVVGVLSASVWGLASLGGSSEGSQLILTDDVSSSDWVKGNGQASTILVEYGDFQCPACGSTYPIIKHLAEEKGQNIKIVFRHFPLRQNHQHAQLAAQAAEAAGRQGKFWEMHDALFEQQPSWTNEREVEPIFVGYAERLGLDMEKFKTDLKADEIKNKIENDFQSGVRAGVRSTPSFFLNGKQIAVPRTYDDLKAVVEKGGQS